MKKIDFNKLKELSDKEFWRLLGNRLRLSVCDLPRMLFVRHSHALNLISVIIVLILAGYLVIALFVLVPPDVDVESKGQQKLSTDLIERIGLWIDERGQEKNRLLELSDDNLYERPRVIKE